ncbi:aminoacyl-tRNA hydrolase [Candidatus Nomurabacteria bacterium]|nr:aminoacyl-tRNA hydrolase [Candidatus Nomurabacteria bacterium]
MAIIIGLGNPGKEHILQRHNVGFMVLDTLAEKKDFSFEEKNTFDAQVAKYSDLLLVKPQTYMNDSGLCAKKLFKQYKELPIVVYDDIDINLGEVKCSFARGAGGHNGVQSIIDHLGTKDFFRIRVGVRPVHEELKDKILPPTGFQDFLLSNFVPFENELKEKGINKAVEIIEALKTKSFEDVMNEFN